MMNLSLPNPFCSTSWAAKFIADSAREHGIKFAARVAYLPGVKDVDVV